MTSRNLKFSLFRHFKTAAPEIEKTYLASVRGAHKGPDAELWKPHSDEAAELIDDNRLVIHLEDPIPTFPYRLDDSVFSVVPPEEVLDDGVTWKSRPVGAGPERVVWESEERDALITERLSQQSPARVAYCSGEGALADILLDPPVIEPEGFS